MHLLPHRLRASIIEWIAGRFKVPPAAVRMFRAANALSGLDRRTLPTELVPLNALQLSRGLLNFTVLQSAPGWVLPYWAERQYDPASSSFIPRAHSGLSINMTHRNWTDVGTPDCDIEPIVDPRGLVTPLCGGWSIDTWLVVDGKAVFPSCVSSVQQSLIDGVPVVRTVFGHESVRVELVSYSNKSTLYHAATVSDVGTGAGKCRLLFALRPFNPEGVSLVHQVQYNAKLHEFVVNGKERLLLAESPDGVHCSAYSAGDAATMAAKPVGDLDARATHCPLGLANAVAVFDLSNCNTRETRSCAVPLTAEAVVDFTTVSPQSAVMEWQHLLNRGAQLQTPEPFLNAIFRSSAAMLLSLVDREAITPGPSTYHHFWFRDAAYMIWALDKLGYADITQRLLKAYPKRQDRSGYFRSQQGEWDSNGQALWTIWQHLLLTGDTGILQELHGPMRKAVSWIAVMRAQEKKRQGPAGNGLLPQGLSAEHFGVADHYFWDNWWSCAGIEAYLAVCETLGTPDHDAERQLVDYQKDLEHAIDEAQSKNHEGGIPAGPGRQTDCGMVGSTLPWYPLQYYATDDKRMWATLEEIEKAYVKDGLFFQHFVHSGFNSYLSMQIAHAWLFAGERERFFKAFRKILSRASPTGGFPEAIHPSTGGGCMGDGSHGWAAAEVVLALRDALVYERQSDDTLVILGGIPSEWLATGQSFSLTRAPVTGGTISISSVAEEQRVTLKIGYEQKSTTPAGAMEVRLPIAAKEVLGCDGQGVLVSKEYGETSVTLPRGNVELVVER